MCGRFALHARSEEIREVFDVEGPVEVPRSYNIPPGQSIPAIRNPSSSNSEREVTSLQWGLVPFWADDADIGSSLINARSETVLEKPSFRDAFRKRRCLIPASGFYEWKSTNGSKQPYYITSDSQSLFAFAGLWEHWEDEETDDEINSCTILTTDPNQLMRPIHNRMPVILHPSRYDAWLNTGENPEDLTAFFTPYQSDRLEAYPVSRHVNNPEHDDPTCIEPVEQTSS